MLNEFKRPMWNDGPAKQPWLNYFNEYERTHCCFGDDDNPDWVHISYVNDKDNRNRRLRAERINGKTTYRII